MSDETPLTSHSGDSLLPSSSSGVRKFAFPLPSGVDNSSKNLPHKAGHTKGVTQENLNSANAGSPVHPLSHENISDMPTQRNTFDRTVNLTNAQRTALEKLHHSAEDARLEFFQRFGNSSSDQQIFDDEFCGTMHSLNELVHQSRNYHDLQEVERQVQLECARLRQALPTYAHRSNICHQVKTSRVSLILADTGSGKSTQIPQYLLSVPQFHRILCTQPRKVAALSLAKRVSEELQTRLGGPEVGQCVGGGNKMKHPVPRLLFTTDSFLLRECVKDPLLKSYNVVIVDEAHERSLHTDMLLAMLKHCVVQRPDDFRVVITSATMDASLFRDYFHDAVGPVPLLQVPGRKFHVDVHYQDVQERSEPGKSMLRVPKDYVQRVVDKVREVCKEKPPGGVLAFLTTPVETELCTNILKSERNAAAPDMWVLQLHGRLQPEEQQKVFQPCPGGDGQRKVVFATNIAETSVTIPDVRYVVDCGLVKEQTFDARRNATTLETVWVSKSSATQRSGRAGRTGHGECFRLYSKAQFDAMRPTFIAEMLRTNLCQVVLYLLQMKMEDPLNFDFIEKPPKESLVKAVDMLVTLGAVLWDENILRLTVLGTRIAQLSMVDPRLAKLILLASEEENSHEDLLPAAVALASCVTVGNLFFRAGTDEEKNSADVRKTQFCDEKGDIAAFLRVFLQWSEHPMKNKGRWCRENYINGKCLRSVEELFKEVRHAVEPLLPPEHPCRDARFKRTISLTPELVDSLMHLFCKCYAENVAMFSGHPRQGYFAPSLEEYVRLHPSSALSYNVESEDWPQWVVFEYVMHSSDAFMFNVVNVLKEEWLSELLPEEWRQKCHSRKLQRTLLEGGFGTAAKNHVMKHRTDLAKIVSEPFFLQYQSSNKFKRLELFAFPSCLSPIMDHIERLVKPIRMESKQQLREQGIHRNSAVRMCLGAGGAVVDVLLSREFRSCDIKQVPVKSSGKEVVRQTLESIVGVEGVTDIYSKPHSPNVVTIEHWGSVCFASKEVAQRAVDQLSQLQDPPFSLKSITMTSTRGNANLSQSNLTIRFSWCRRPAENYGYIRLESADQAIKAASVISETSNGEYQASLNRRNNEEVRVVQSSGHIDCNKDEDFVDRIRNLLQSSDISVVSGYMMRKKAYQTTPHLIASYRDKFVAHFQHLPHQLPPEAYKLDFFIPKVGGTLFQQGTLTLYNLHQAEFVTQSLKNVPLFVENELVNFMSFSIDVTFFPNLLKVLEEELKALETDTSRLCPDTTIEIVTLKSGRVAARIQSPSPKLTLDLRQTVLNLLNGEILQNAVLAFALSHSQGQGFLKTLLESLGPYLDVHVDRWKGIVTLRGSKNSIVRAKIQMKIFEGTVTEEQAVIRLRPPEYPSALMRKLLLHCHHDLEQLQLKDCAMVKLNCPQRTITYQGSTAGRAQLMKILEDLSTGIPEGSNANTDSVDCVVCLCPLEANKWRCLSVCGHYYCTDCFKNQFNVALKDREFPIVCASEKCGESWAITDIEALLKEGLGTAADQQGDRGKQNSKSVVVNWQPVMEASRTSFLRNSKDYKNCVTPDCVGIYRRSDHSQVHSCDLCDASVCTACDKPFHEGMTCALYAAMLKEDPESVTRWMEGDTANRRPCPKCRVVIEKNGGCPHVWCRHCNIHMCWMCMATFTSSGETYAHMESNVCRPRQH